MRNFFITIGISLMLITGSAIEAAEVPDRDESMLRTAFEEPLHTELLRRGLTPRNAAMASQHVLDNLIECWESPRNVSTGAEEQTIVVQLGGKSIVTHASPCIDDFLKTVGEISP